MFCKGRSGGVHHYLRNEGPGRPINIPPHSSFGRMEVKRVLERVAWENSVAQHE
jgi:hypothetical protein